MKHSLISAPRLALAAGITLFLTSAHGASVLISDTNWSTSFTGSSATINEAVNGNYDLSDLAGLTPNQPIEVSLTVPTPITWSGEWSGSGTNPVTINWQATVVISVGSESDSFTATESLDAFSADDFDGVEGFNTLSDTMNLSFVVLWGTDLSSVSLSLTDQSFVTGAGLAFVRSDMNAPNASLSTASVPEPSSTALLGLGGLALMLRRRR